jgi:methyltransferase (TIGR00027 family)
VRDSVASHTALRVAIRRAEHQVLDHPRLFDDPLSIRIIGPEAAALIQPGVISRRQRLTPSFRAFMAVRSRYAEDELARFVQRGVRQYVVLGAGLDTFAFRNPHAGLHVYEVDHPATQAWKRECLSAADIATPEGVTFVAANFERESLSEALSASGFDFARPAFFSWLGVTMYLTADAFTRTLEFVAARPSPTAIVFDYAVERDSLNEVQKMAFDALAARVTAFGEPFQLFFDQEKLHAQLHRLGFDSIEDLGREQVNARYFSGRSDDFRVRANLARLLRAATYQSAGL